jgi:putative transposase
MKKSRYTEEQIAFALRQAETGTPVGEVIRKMAISTQTFYRWKKQYGQMGVDEIRRLKQLEEENRKLKLQIHESAKPGDISGLVVIRSEVGKNIRSRYTLLLERMLFQVVEAPSESRVFLFFAVCCWIIRRLRLS